MVAAVVASAAVAFLHGGNLVVVDLGTHQQRVVMHNAGIGPVRWSGDGRLVSSGGKIAGGPTLPTAQPVWAPAGETAAWVTKRGGVRMWSRAQGFRTVIRNGWGAWSIAWKGATLVVGRSICQQCGKPPHHEIWEVRDGKRRLLLKRPNDAGLPMPFAIDPRGRILWWDWPYSGSIASDGVALYANGTKIASMLMYPDWVAPCGSTLALAVGGDRNSMHGKSIVLDGRDVSQDRSRSWVSPACSADGRTLVATADQNTTDGPWGREHRAVWQLLPTRRRLTHPPRGWTDEAPTLLSDGSILFVRTRQTSAQVNGAWIEHDRGTLEILRHGTITPVADLSFSANELSGAFAQFYGHYTWPQRMAVRR